jgi:hypothetical protein
VFHIDLLMAEPDGFALRGAQSFLGFLGEAIDVHMLLQMNDLEPY